MLIDRRGAAVRGALAGVLALVVALAGLLSPIALAVVVAVPVTLFALGWPRLIGLPSPRGSTAVIATTGYLGIVSVLAVGTLVPLLAVLALAVVMAFVHEMARRDGRLHLVESVSGTVLGAVAAANAAGWVPLALSTEDRGLLVAAAAALVAGGLVTGLPVATWWRAGGSLAAAAVGGLVVGLTMAEIAPVEGALVGAGAGAVTAAVVLLFDRYEVGERTLRSAAIAALPVVTIGVPAYAVAALLSV